MRAMIRLEITYGGAIGHALGTREFDPASQHPAQRHQNQRWSAQAQERRRLRHLLQDFDLFRRGHRERATVQVTVKHPKQGDTQAGESHRCGRQNAGEF